MTPHAKSIEVGIVAGHVVVRAGVRHILQHHGHFKVAGEASNVPDALLLIGKAPDVVIVDPDSEEVPLTAVKELSQDGAGRLLVLTGACDARVHRQAFEFGAVGLVLKNQPQETLVRALEKVHAGELWLDRAKTANLLHALLRPNNPEDVKIQTLTKREREVVALVGRGLKNAAIGERLFISEATVRNHLTSVLSKLELSNRFELVIYSFRNGLIEPETREAFGIGPARAAG